MARMVFIEITFPCWVGGVRRLAGEALKLAPLDALDVVRCGRARFTDAAGREAAIEAQREADRKLGKLHPMPPREPSAWHPR